MDKDQFQELYKQYYGNVYRLCLGYVRGEKSLAEDIAQEVFMQIWLKYDSFKGNSQLSTWLYRIAVNCCLSEIRRNKSYQSRIRSYQVPEHDTAEKQQADQQMLNLCIAKLEESDRILAVLVLEDLPQQEIAGILGISESSIRVRVHRLKEKLRTIYMKLSPSIE
jgi:RNA polymerase sigma-70 factor (ECF subfamily)